MNSKLKNNKTALLLIDIQQGFTSSYWGRRNNPMAEKTIQKLLKFCRKLNLPIFHIQHVSKNPHSPLRPNQPGVKFMNFIKPRKNEIIIQKNVNSAFIGTDLNDLLILKNISELIIVGFTSDHCVSTSARMASNLGYKVLLIEDACIAFDRERDGEIYQAELVHQVSLASLHSEFSTVINYKELIQENPPN